MPRSSRRPRPAPLASAALAFVVLMLAGCDSGGPNEPPERVGVTGVWAGTLTYDNTADTLPPQTFVVEMTLEDVVSTITGSGSVTLPSERLAFVVQNGLYDSRLRTMRLTLLFGRPPLGNLSGNLSVARDAIEGTMSGPGLVNGRVSMTLNLQRAR